MSNVWVHLPYFGTFWMIMYVSGSLSKAGDSTKDGVCRHSPCNNILKSLIRSHNYLSRDNGK
jgi:hypothetical protein